MMDLNMKKTNMDILGGRQELPESGLFQTKPNSVNKKTKLKTFSMPPLLCHKLKLFEHSSIFGVFLSALELLVL